MFLVLQPTVSPTDASFVSDKPCFAMDINTISYTRTLSDKWGTLVLPFAIEPTGKEPYRIYTIEAINESELVLSSISGEVAAGTPCVVQRIGKQTELCFKADRARLNVTPGAIDIADMTLNGTFSTKGPDEGFIIAKDRFLECCRPKELIVYGERCEGRAVPCMAQRHIRKRHNTICNAH